MTLNHAAMPSCLTAGEAMNEPLLDSNEQWEYYTCTPVH